MILTLSPHFTGCDEFYIPPDGGLDLRGFSAAATFVRGVFDKVLITTISITLSIDNLNTPEHDNLTSHFLF